MSSRSRCGPMHLRRDSTARGRLAAAARGPPRRDGWVPPGVIRERAGELRRLGEAKGAAYRARRAGQTADGVVSGHQRGRVEVMTQDYLSVYLDSEQWDGRPRLEVTVN